MSYCAGDAGIEAAHASTARALLASSSKLSSDPSQEGKSEDLRGRIEQNYSKKRVGEGDVTLHKERLSEALNEEKKRKARGGDDENLFSKKQKGLDGGSHDVTEEELGKFLCRLMVCVALIDLSPCRGLSPKSPKHGRSNGQLCRHRGRILNTELWWCSPLPYRGILVFVFSSELLNQ
jgi:hypothetical protein